MFGARRKRLDKALNFFNIAIGAARHGDHIRAIEYGRRANGEYAHHAFVDIVGVCHEALGRFNDGARCYDEARELCVDPEGIDPYRHRPEPRLPWEYSIFTVKSSVAFLRAGQFEFAFERSSHLIRSSLLTKSSPGCSIVGVVDVRAHLARLVSGLQMDTVPRAIEEALMDVEWFENHGFRHRARYGELWSSVTRENCRTASMRDGVLKQWVGIDAPMRAYSDEILIEGSIWRLE